MKPFFDIMNYGGSMKYYMDEDTFHQIWGNDDFERFLNKTSDICRYPFDKEKKSNLMPSDSSFDETQKYNCKTQVCTSTEDFKIFMQLTWLELYLPRFELQYGMFEYSNSNLSNLEKLNELIGYYEEQCGVTNINDIRKNSFKAFKHR